MVVISASAKYREIFVPHRDRHYFVTAFILRSIQLEACSLNVRTTDAVTGTTQVAILYDHTCG
jgi:hypothetical protein